MARLVRAARRLLPAGPATRRTRAVRTGSAVVAAALVLLALRSAAEPVDDAAPVPADAVVTVVPPLPDPPFDRLPGRTPIPVPTFSGDDVLGALPPVRGGPDRAAAAAATELVLGRYCRRPDRYTVTFDPGRDWRDVAVLVFGLDRSGDPPVVRLRLTWTGVSYGWRGQAVQLNRC